MPDTNLPVLRTRGGLIQSRSKRRDMAVAEAVGDIHAEMFIERARDSAERDLATLKVSDIAHVGRHGIAEAADVIDLATAKAAANPVCAGAVGGLAQTTVQGIEQQLRRLTREG